MTSLPILLPYGYFPLVNQNDTISVGQKIAENRAPQEEIINIAKELGISIRKAKKVLQKNPGDPVTEGEIIAIKKSLFGIKKEAVISKITGIIIKYERDTGDLYIRTSYNNLTQDFISPVAGIVSLCDNEKIVISVEQNVILGTNASEAQAEGEVFVFEDASAATQIFFLDSKVIGKVVVAESLSRESLTKGIAVGAIGFIGAQIEPRDIEYIRQKHTHVPVMQIDQDSLQTLATWKNKKIYLDGQARSIILLQV
jgi:hypothetical protein